MIIGYCEKVETQELFFASWANACVCVCVHVCDAVKVVTGLDGKNGGFGFSHPLVYALIQPCTLCAVLGMFIIFSKHLLSLAPSGRLESHFKD